MNACPLCSVSPDSGRLVTDRQTAKGSEIDLCWTWLRVTKGANLAISPGCQNEGGILAS